jgi:hypothetical protein
MQHEQNEITGAESNNMQKKEKAHNIDFEKRYRSISIQRYVTSQDICCIVLRLDMAQKRGPLTVCLGVYPPGTGTGPLIDHQGLSWWAHS